MNLQTKRYLTTNTVNVIFPYRTKQGIWCFDDDRVGLVAEPFVGTINIMLDMYATGREQLTVYISSSPIGGQTLSLTKVNDNGDYQLDGTDMVGWLCQATHHYFPGYPSKIYAKIQ